jgi:hypothetical protein
MFLMHSIMSCSYTPVKWIDVKNPKKLLDIFKINNIIIINIGKE